jgi:hypothetical protein
MRPSSAYAQNSGSRVSVMRPMVTLRVTVAGPRIYWRVRWRLRVRGPVFGVPVPGQCDRLVLVLARSGAHAERAGRALTALSRPRARRHPGSRSASVSLVPHGPYRGSPSSHPAASWMPRPPKVSPAMHRPGQPRTAAASVQRRAGAAGSSRARSRPCRTGPAGRPCHRQRAASPARLAAPRHAPPAAIPQSGPVRRRLRPQSAIPPPP